MDIFLSFTVCLSCLKRMAVSIAAVDDVLGSLGTAAGFVIALYFLHRRERGDPQP